MASSQLSPRAILAEVTAHSRRLAAAGLAALCFPLGSADTFAVNAENSLCCLLSPAARLPRHRDGRSGHMKPAAVLLSVHSQRRTRFLSFLALSCPGVFSCEEERWEAWASQLHPELEVQV